MDGLFAALINLDHYGRFITWHNISIGVANLIVVILMVVVFVLALTLPFPGRRHRKEDHR